MSSTKSQVAAATNIPNLSSGQQQKEYSTEEQLGRQNSFTLNRRSNMKGKHLTRSHAMRESTSPPRTPTPRASESSSQMSPNGYQQQQHIDAKEAHNNSNMNKLQTLSSATRGNSPTMDTHSDIVSSQNKQQQYANVSLCNEAEFPKLSPPKSKGNNGGGSGGSTNEIQNKSINNMNVTAGNASKNYNQSRQQRKLSEGKGTNDALNALFLEGTQQSRPICNSPMNYQLHSNDGNSHQQQQQTFIVHDKENNSSNNNQRRINNISEGHCSNNNNNSNIGCNKKANDDPIGVNEAHNKSSNNMNAIAGNANKNYNQSRQHKKLRAGKELQEALSALFIDEPQSTQNCNSPMNYQSNSIDGNSQQQPFVAYEKENNSNSNNNNSNSSSSSCSQRRNNNTSDVYNNNINSNKNNNNSNIATCSNKNANDDITCMNETHNKSTNNISATSGSANKIFNQSRQQRKLSDALNSIYIDEAQSTPICNSPMNYQLHPSDATGSQQHQQSYISYDKENRCPRNDSQNSMNSGDELHYEAQHHQQQHHQNQQQQQQQHNQRSNGCAGSGKKHRTNSNSKGSKTRLKNMGGNSNNNGGSGGGVTAGGMATGSIDGSLNSSNNTSGFISRENSNEQYTDHGGTDLLSFFKETLNKNVKDRQFLLKVEKDLIEFVQEGNRGEIRFPQASSYNRMLIHRTAAFFGMDHNVDTETQQCVIVAPTKNTRIPEIRFKTLVINNRDDSRKSILKRDTHSFDEARQSSYLCPERGGMLDRKAKSFEEREEDYDRARSRIFNRTQNESCMGSAGSTEDDNNYISWTSSVEQQQFSRGRPNGKSPDGRNSGNVVQKSNSNFGNYGGPNQGATSLIRGDSANSNKSMGANSGNGTRFFSKQDPAGNSNTSWRLSPSSSGYKTQTHSIRSDSVTPSPTGGYGSDELHTPDHSSSIANREISEVASSLPSGLVWAVTDISNVPKGSILINPQTLQPILNADGTVYHYDPSNMPPAQAMTGGNVPSNGGVFHTSQNNSSLQQHTVHNVIKKQQKGHQIQQQQQQQSQSQQQQHQNKFESTPTGVVVCETVAESSTQTINPCDEVSAAANLSDVNYQEDNCNQDENEECDNSANDCLSITTTTSAKNYDRIEVQKFKNQATSPNIPLNEKDESVKPEHSIQTPVNISPTQQSQMQQCQTAQQSQVAQNRETPHSSRSTPFSNSDTLTKRSSEESRATCWTQSYQAPDGSTVFHTTSTPNNSGANPYCTTTTYQQGPDGSIYAVPQGMIYAYPPPVDGEFQGYFMPLLDPSQQRADGTGLLQTGAPSIYPAGGAATMVPVATYPTTPFAATNGPPIYPSQVIYSGEQFQPAGASLSTTVPASATTQLQQIPMTTYPIGYPYPYNGYWGQTMAYYVPQQAVPSTTLLTAPPPSTPANGSHVAGGVSNNSLNGGISAAGPSNNSSNSTNNSSGHVGNGNTSNANHSNGSVVTGYQSHVHAVGGSGNGVVGSSHTGGTTYYGTGRIKRPNPPHFSSPGNNGAHQVLAAASLPNGVATATYQLGHAVPTLTLAAAPPPQPTTGAPASTDLSGNSGAPATATMYALPQHATIFPANVFPYTASAAAPSIASQPATNMASQTAIISTPGNLQNHCTGGQENSTAGKIHNAHHSNTVITHFYTTTHHHAPHPGIHSGGHSIHAPGPSAIPIVDPASIAGNVTSIAPVANASYTARGIGSVIAAGASQSAPSTPHSMPTSSNIQQSQRISTVFSTPPIISSNGGNYNSSNSSPQYYVNTELSHQTSAPNAGGANSSNSSHNSYVSSTYEKRSNPSSGSGKKSHSYQSASLSRQNSSSGGGYNGSGKPSPLLINANGNNNDLRASPSSSSTNSRPHSIKRGGGAGGVSVGGSATNDKSQTPLLSGTSSFVGGANNQTSNNSSYQVGPNSEVGTSSIPIVNVSKPPIRLNAAAAAFRQKGSTSASVVASVVEYRRNPTSQRNSPGTNASSNDNSNNNSPNSIHNSSNAATPLAAGCYAPSYIITAQNNAGEPTPQHQPSLYITTAPARGPSHIPPHLQSGAATGVAVPAAAAAATASVPAQTATAVLGGAAAAAAAADVANAAAVAAAAATVAHHHHHQPLLGTYNPGASGLYFKYGHTYFAHPSVALQNSRRSPSTDLRPPIPQMAGMYPTVNMMIPAQPRHPGRHPNPNYKGTRPR